MRLSASELSEWRAFEQIDGPLGGERGDWQAALISYWGLLPHLKSDDIGDEIAITPEDLKFRWTPREEDDGFIPEDEVPDYDG